ncbi:MAG: sigma-70 family RNA polymerase sigma factor [Pirellulales bacterium]|nr:sigma-70 family RNA polymerase sigma factor [Pirellulales bacterium]
MNWEELIGNCGEKLFRRAYRVLHHTADAEDVTQEVLLEAFRMQRRDGCLPPWPLLLRMTTLRAIDRLRRRRPDCESSHADSVSLSLQPTDSLVRREDMKRLQEAMANLPQRERQCFALRYIEGMSNEQIAELLEIKPNAVSTALHKARTKLRRALQPAMQ